MLRFGELTGHSSIDGKTRQHFQELGQPLKFSTIVSQPSRVCKVGTLASRYSFTLPSLSPAPAADSELVA
jgi:hypothetical protein